MLQTPLISFSAACIDQPQCNGAKGLVLSPQSRSRLGWVKLTAFDAAGCGVLNGGRKKTGGSELRAEDPVVGVSGINGAKRESIWLYLLRTQPDNDDWGDKLILLLLGISGGSGEASPKL